MSNDLPVVQNTRAAVALLTGNKVSQTSAGGGGNFIRFDSKRTGQWTFGMDNEPCTGDVFSLDVASLKHGWQQWHLKKCNRRMVPINQEIGFPNAPIIHTVGGKEVIDNDNEARAFHGSFDDGLKFEFETSTFGGRKAVDALLAELFTRAATGNPFMFPQVELGSNSYDHANFGKVFEPVLTAVAWFDGEGNPESGAPKKLAREEPAPAPAPAPAPEDDAPRRRTRRS